jgi:hypothetical protein
MYLRKVRVHVVAACLDRYPSRISSRGKTSGFDYWKGCWDENLMSKLSLALDLDLELDLALGIDCIRLDSTRLDF